MEESIARHVVLSYQVGEKRSDVMLKFDFTNKELEDIKSKIHFTPLQQRIIDYRIDELSIVQMSMKENCSESKISKEIRKISKKMNKVI